VGGETVITHLILSGRFDPQPSAVIHKGIEETVDNQPPL
jgi:hypothetical protein